MYFIYTYGSSPLTELPNRLIHYSKGGSPFTENGKQLIMMLDDIKADETYEPMKHIKRRAIDREC